jgi:hypothetical protein
MSTNSSYNPWKKVYTFRRKGKTDIARWGRGKVGISVEVSKPGRWPFQRRWNWKWSGGNNLDQAAINEVGAFVGIGKELSNMKQQNHWNSKLYIFRNLILQFTWIFLATQLYSERIQTLANSDDSTLKYFYQCLFKKNNCEMLWETQTL